MKRVIIALCILLLPVAAFAQFQIGPTAYYNFPLLEGGEMDIPEVQGIDSSDFTFGADARLKLAIFQVSGLALFTPGFVADDYSYYWPPSIDIFLDAGVAFDIAFLRLGLGFGPNFSFFLLGDEYGSAEFSDPVSFGTNLRATADIVLGGVSFGLSYLMQFDFELGEATAQQILDADKTQGLLGISVLLQLGG